MSLPRPWRPTLDRAAATRRLEPRCQDVSE
jgi:hypothetical protein